MKNRILVIVCAIALAAGASFAGRTGPGPVGPDDCPDFDGDGICNGQDPDYVPGDDCPNLDYLVVLLGGNPNAPDSDDPLYLYGYFGGREECPDADSDGICNGQDPDYVPGDDCPYAD